MEFGAIFKPNGKRVKQYKPLLVEKDFISHKFF